MSAERVAPAPWAPSRFAPVARVVPAQVEVCQVDGVYQDARRLRDAAAALSHAADTLERLKGGQR